MCGRCPGGTLVAFRCDHRRGVASRDDLLELRPLALSDAARFVELLGSRRRDDLVAIALVFLELEGFQQFFGFCCARPLAIARAAEHQLEAVDMDAFEHLLMGFFPDSGNPGLQEIGEREILAEPLRA